MLQKFRGRAALSLAFVLLCSVALAQTAPAQQADSPEARRAQVVAKHAHGGVTVGEVEDAIANKVLHLRRELNASDSRQRLLRELTDYELLVAEARRRGYAEHPRVKDAAAIEAVRLLRLELAAHITPEALEAGEVAAYYADKREMFSAKPLRRASFIKFPSLAEAAAFRAEAIGMDLDAFRRMAVRKDARGRGGELTYVDEEGRPGGNPHTAPLDMTLTRTAYALDEVGQLSEPVEYDGGFIIMRLTGRTPGHGLTLQDAEPRVREKLALIRVQEAFEAEVGRLRRVHPVVLNRELIERIVLPPVETPDIPSGFSAAPPDPAAPTVVVEPDDA